MGTGEQALLEHGFTGDRLLKLCRKIANDELARKGAFLDHERLEDLVQFLALHGVRAALRYDPERLQRSYGRDGGDPFASWIADILSHRVTDWYRTKAEGGGDRRYNNDRRIVLAGDTIEDDPDPDDAFEREFALRRMEQGVDLDEAEVELGRGLSEQAKVGVHLARLHVEGRPNSSARRTQNGKLTKVGKSWEAAHRELAGRALKPRPKRRKRPPIRAAVTNGVQIRPLMALPDVTARLNYSERTVRRLIARGDLPAIQPGGAGGRIRVDPDELEGWLARQRVPTRGAA